MPRECGTPVRSELQGREFEFYLPAGLCDGRLAAAPLLVLIHCFGCTASLEIAKFAAAADAFGFALLAPEGYKRSFNSPSCCGDAQAESLDDVGFVDDLVALARTTLPVVRDAVYASGFSNGGFLVSHLAGAARTAFRGIAPVSGHEYEVDARQPLPVFMHHCADDTMVKPAGCCASAPCCCNIAARRAECVPTRALFDRWLRANACAGHEKTAGPKGASCLRGRGCAAETVFCSYGLGCYHQEWGRDFVGAHAVVRFFAHEAPPAQPRPHSPPSDQVSSRQTMCTLPSLPGVLVRFGVF